MIIKFSWGTGRMRVDPDLLIRDMPMGNFRKWVKLFTRYAEPDQIEAFQQVLNKQIQDRSQHLKDLEAEITEFQMKANRTVPTMLAPKYCLEQARLRQRHLNGTVRGLKRCHTMSEILKGLLS